MNVDDLRDKTIVVTGGAQGIGKAIALRLARAGAYVVAADIDGEAGAEIAEEVSGWGELRFVQVDVSDEPSVAQMVAAAVAWRGAVHGLVNNAGIANPGSTPVESLDLAAWNRMIGTNLTGVFLCTKHAVPHLRAGGGAIVNIASTRALQATPHTEAYSASKGGVVSLTQALAMSLGPTVRVNVISPGWIAVSDWKKRADRTVPDLRAIDHEQHPAGRVGTPDDIAAMAAFLLSDAAGFITGQNFVVDGGMTRKMIYAD
ncbi:MAG: SDR family oxidoreductase [Caldilineaceae bacterium]|nr:SDR family oxidoreductase [Caldilinea sp.]MCB0067830.1 SDR family oxidoreductase [Caldilineaceae bacterium]MCB9122349.1 SDR family oxidoreductase [Caldilineaceae bacterium]